MVCEAEVPSSAGLGAKRRQIAKEAPRGTRDPADRPSLASSTCQRAEWGVSAPHPTPARLALPPDGAPQNDLSRFKTCATTGRPCPAKTLAKLMRSNGIVGISPEAGPRPPRGPTSAPAHLLVNGRHDGTGGLSPRTVKYVHSIIGRALKDVREKA